jgi:hypothetical protein
VLPLLRQPVGDKDVHFAARLVADHAILSEQNCDRLVRAVELPSAISWLGSQAAERQPEA